MGLELMILRPRVTHLPTGPTRCPSQNNLLNSCCNQDCTGEAFEVRVTCGHKANKDRAKIHQQVCPIPEPRRYLLSMNTSQLALYALLFDILYMQPTPSSFSLHRLSFLFPGGCLFSVKESL